MTAIFNNVKVAVTGLLACVAVMLLVVSFENGLGSGVDYIVKYTMPIFLLHTVFAEFLKAVLMELSVENTGVSRGVGTFV